jgi:hypothetical protein
VGEVRMKTDEEIMELIQKCLASGMDRLWDQLLPEERMKAFPKLILEWVESTY